MISVWCKWWRFPEPTWGAASSFRQVACTLGCSTVYTDVSVPITANPSTAVLYDEAFEAHWDAVFRFSLAWTNDWPSADDITQEAFLHLWRHRTKFDWTQSALPWLFVTARRLATDRFRVLRRPIRHRVQSEASFEEVRNRWLDVRAALANLSTLERTALVLTAVEGQSYADAAPQLGVTVGAARAAVSLARAKLEVA